MQHPIRALRVTSDRGGSNTHGEVEIRATRGNADLLGMIARRARTLMTVMPTSGSPRFVPRTAAAARSR